MDAVSALRILQVRIALMLGCFHSTVESKSRLDGRAQGAVNAAHPAGAPQGSVLGPV